MLRFLLEFCQYFHITDVFLGQVDVHHLEFVFGERFIKGFRIFVRVFLLFSLIYEDPRNLVVEGPLELLLFPLVELIGRHRLESNGEVSHLYCLVLVFLYVSHLSVFEPTHEPQQDNDGHPVEQHDEYREVALWDLNLAFTFRPCLEDYRVLAASCESQDDGLWLALVLCYSVEAGEIPCGFLSLCQYL